MVEDQQTCYFFPYFRDSHKYNLPLCFNLAHRRAGFSSIFDRVPLRLPRAMFPRDRCSTCLKHKVKQQLVWYMCFSTAKPQVTWACLQSSSSIFHFSQYLMTDSDWSNAAGDGRLDLTLFCIVTALYLWVQFYSICKSFLGPGPWDGWQCANWDFQESPSWEYYSLLQPSDLNFEGICFLFLFIAWKVAQEPSSWSKNCQWKCWESNDCLLN